MVELQIVVLAVAGSSPVGHPTFFSPPRPPRLFPAHSGSLSPGFHTGLLFPGFLRAFAVVCGWAALGAIGVNGRAPAWADGFR